MVARDHQGRPVGGSGSSVTVRDLGRSSRLIPVGVRRQLAAKRALNILLELFYHQPHKDGFSKGTDYGVLTEDRESGVVVSYVLPGSDSRVELKPLPRELFE
jgi:hypothetical protein